MAQTAAATADRDPQARSFYDKLEERILARDQMGASEVYYDLVRRGRPLPEMLREAVRIHAPYTHVPYHERIDDGYVELRQQRPLPAERARDAASRRSWLPRAGRPADGADHLVHPDRARHLEPEDRQGARPLLARGFDADGPPPAPVVHWPDQEPLQLDGPLKERLDHWMTLVHRGQVLDAYRVFLGLMENPAERREVLAELVFAGLIDVQDRAFHNRSYTTGHKAYPRPRHGRARQRDRLGQRARRALCRRARHRGRPALVLDLRDGLQRRHASISRADAARPFPMAARRERELRDARQQQGAADRAPRREALIEVAPARSPSPPTSKLSPSC